MKEFNVNNIRVETAVSKCELELLYNLATNCSKEKAIVEIGSFKGASTIALGMGAKYGHKNKVYAIDPHKGGSLPEFIDNIKNAGLENVVKPIIKTSEEASKGWNEPIELLWIDGDHRYEMAKLDFEKFVPHLIEGGVVCLHDSIYRGPSRVVYGGIINSCDFCRIRFVDVTTCATKSKECSNTERALKIKFFMRRTVGVFAGFGTKLPLPHSFASKLRNNLGYCILRYFSPKTKE